MSALEAMTMADEGLSWRKLRRAAGALALLFAPAYVAAAFDPACLPWAAAHYRAEKLFLEVDLELRGTVVSALAPDALRPTLERPGLVPKSESLVLDVRMEGPGWRSFTGQWFLQPDSGAVLQYSSLRAPSPRYRTYRFAETGAERTTARPREGEEALPPRRWSDVDVRQRRFTAEAPVLEISTLLYLLPASTLRAQGDHIDLLGYATSADALFDLDARAGEGLRLAVDYALQSDGSSTTRRRIIEALPVVLTGRPRSTDPDEQTFDLLGLRDVRFLIDPDYRVVAALRAQVPGAGQVQFQLVALELRDELPARCAPAGA
jgi:hypothetical protein